jgi:hypothetical protein
VAKEGGKGRPTPTRKEAEAAARARAKATVNKKEAARMSRQQRSSQAAKMRQAMKTGDERNLPARDKGPVRRFTRDLVDSRLCMAEFLLPVLLISVLLQAVKPGISIGLSNAAIVLVVIDSIVLVVKLRRQLAARFEGQSTKGVTLYALTRSLQIRFLRLPKAQVKLGHKLPERY